MTKERARDVEVILLPEDDLMHPVEAASNFNESAYYNFFDSRQRAGGWVRIGNRPNEKVAEVTVCLYEPNGTAAFAFKRPEIADNHAHDAGGLRFEVIEPFREHRVSYQGRACILGDPLEMADPRAAFTKNPHEPVSIDLSWRGLSPGWGGEPRRRLPDGSIVSASSSGEGNQFARGHLEQHGAATGTITIAGRCYEIDGFGLRDHSWGPRYWQNTGWYRWLTMNFGADLGLMGLVTEAPDGERSHGYLYREGRPNTAIRKVELETEVAGDQKVHDRLRVRLHPEDGPPLEVTGRVLSLVPCRNRRAGWVTRVSEGFTEWTLASSSGNRTGYGMSEYLDHLERGE